MVSKSFDYHQSVLGGIDPVVSIKDLDMNFDIVHLHDTLPVLIRRSVKRARKEKIPVVTTFHNDYIKTSLGGKILKHIRWALQGRRTLHASNARIALTPYYAKHLKDRGVRKSIDVLPNGFNLLLKMLFVLPHFLPMQKNVHCSYLLDD